jgi:hypothetical protein
MTEWGMTSNICDKTGCPENFLTSLMVILCVETQNLTNDLQYQFFWNLFKYV